MSGERPLVCVTIDVEDWIQSTLDFDASLTSRCEHNTHAMLDFLDELHTRRDSEVCFDEDFFEFLERPLYASAARERRDVEHCDVDDLLP